MSFGQMNRSRTAWVLFGAMLAGTLVFVVYSFVGTFVFGVFIYYATRPIYRRLRRRVGPPSVAAAVALFALALPALLLSLYALAIVAGEIQRLAQNDAVDVTQYYPFDPTVLDDVADPSTLLGANLSGYASPERLVGLLRSLGQAFDTLAFVGVGAVHLFVMIAIAFYLLRDDHRLSRWLRSRLSDDRGILVAYLRAVDRDFHSIFFGNILNAVLTGTIGVIVYSLLNVVAPSTVRIPTPALVGLLAGVASLVPVVGMKLVYFPVAGFMVLLAFINGGVASLWFVALFAVVSFVVVDTIPDLVLRPYVSGRNLHVGAVMIAYTLGPLLFGWYGIFLMPMALVLVVHFARIVLPELLAGEPIQPYAVDPGSLVEGDGETTQAETSAEPSDSSIAGRGESGDDVSGRESESDAT